MSNTMNRRGYFNGQTSFSWTHDYTCSSSSSKNSARSSYMRSCTFRYIPEKSEFSPVEFLKHLAERVTRALRLVSAERGRTRRRRKRLPKDSSSSPSCSLGRSNSRAGGGGSVDSYRSDAVEDCIEFIHSSFSRSDSSTNSLNTH